MESCKLRYFNSFEFFDQAAGANFLIGTINADGKVGLGVRKVKTRPVKHGL